MLLIIILTQKENALLLLNAQKYLKRTQCEVDNEGTWDKIIPSKVISEFLKLILSNSERNDNNTKAQQCSESMIVIWLVQFLGNILGFIYYEDFYKY